MYMHTTVSVCPFNLCVLIYDSISTLATSTILSAPYPAEPALSRMRVHTHIYSTRARTHSTEEVTVWVMSGEDLDEDCLSITEYTTQRENSLWRILMSEKTLEVILFSFSFFLCFSFTFSCLSTYLLSAVLHMHFLQLCFSTYYHQSLNLQNSTGSVAIIDGT